MNNIEFSEFASKKLAPLRHDGFERASFKYFLESGTVNASFLQLIKELCDEYHEKILNGNILESSESFLPLECPHCGEHFSERIDTEGHRCLLRRNDAERS